jgi:hypothetical protein
MARYYTPLCGSKATVTWCLPDAGSGLSPPENTADYVESVCVAICGLNTLQAHFGRLATKTPSDLPSAFSTALTDEQQ